jgi:gamma-glutamyltranspeptidase/glutathione hydrolase
MRKTNKRSGVLTLCQWRIVLFLFILSQISCTNQEKTTGTSVEIYNINKSALFEKYAVVSAHPLASEIGAQVLADGGNAVDAAIAVQFALAVCYPVAGNIGGGGFMLYRAADGKFEALDFREKAPLAAHRDMYLDSEGELVNGLSLQGHLASGVPGTVDGMWRAFNKLSKLKDWSRLLLPAIELAEQGFAISSQEANWLNRYHEYFIRVNEIKPVFVKDEQWNTGDTLVQPELAKTLKTIAEEGREGFYSGKVAAYMLEEMKKGGGIITQEDLTSYKSIWRKPVKGTYGPYTIISMPPPSSGGVALCQLFNAISAYDIGSLGFHSADAIHLIVEAERRVYADRAMHLGDNDFYDVPVDQLMDKSYMLDRMSDVKMEMATQSDSIHAGTFNESEQTTHFSIVDQWGNAVSLTTTINTAYGSKLVIPGAGFLMNNEMDDFSTKQGVANYFGLLGNEANAIEPGKRMLSSMSPTIVEKEGELHIVLGSPGGSTIITSVFQVLLNIMEFGMSAEEATAACRFHHQWQPDEIKVEDACFETDLIDDLKGRGHRIVERSSIGRIETIVINDDKLLDAAADPRGDDSASGK